MADDGLIDRLRAAFAPQDTQSYAYDPTGYSAPSATPSFLNKYMPAGMFTGDPEAQASAGASQAMSPVVSPYLAKVLSGAMSGDSLKEGLQSVNDAFANHDYPALAGMFAGGGAGIKAYHGSPYDFNAFDASKIGTGEGAQAYGHGLYFAERPETAQAYRDKLAPLSPAQKTAGARILEQGSPEAALQDTLAQLDRMKARGSGDPANLQYLEDVAAALRQGRPPGRMYEADINAEPEQFLQWDRGLSAQPRDVQDILSKLGIERETSQEYLGTRIPVAPSEPTGQGVYTRLSRMGGAEVMGDKARFFPEASSPERASQMLNQAGIPGIRYLDQGSRNAGGWHITPPDSTVSGKWMVKSSDYNSKGLHFDTEAEAQQALQDKIGGQTSNYVVFDPRIVQILKKYGLAGFLPSAGLAAGTGNDQ